MSKSRVIVIDHKDNVATALQPLGRGFEVELHEAGEKITLLADIPLGHKFAIADIGKGEFVIKYGEPIGRSLRKISRGEHVHVHNVASKSRLRSRP